MRILFISANRIGDAVITTGLLDHLIRAYPQSRITVVCGRVAEDVFARMPNRERTILVEKRPYDMHWPTLWRQVAGTAWDIAIDLRGSAMPYLVRAKRRVVLRRLPGRKFEQLGALLGIDPPPLPVVWTAPEDRQLADRLLPPARPVVALGPTANSAYKIWPADRFAALFHRLAAGPLPGAIPAVLAGPGKTEREGARPLLTLLPDAIDLVGRLSLPEVAACIQRSALYAGNDSGLMHLAAAAGTPTIGLCGSTMDRAEEMAPAGRFAAWAMASGPTMEALGIDAALEAALTLLARAGATRGAGEEIFATRTLM